MGRSPCCSKEGLNKGAWTALEDQVLTDYIKTHGEGKWRRIPNEAGLKRCGKSCRLRWLNYLRPDIKRGNITQEEEDLIIRLHNLLGNRWSLIAGRIPGRTDNEIKNYWNTNLVKKVKGTVQKRPKQHSKKNKTSSTTVPLTMVESNNIGVVRTKASRCCNKVVVTSSSQLLAPNKLVDNYHDHHVAPDQTGAVDMAKYMMLSSEDQLDTTTSSSSLQVDQDQFMSDFDHVGKLLMSDEVPDSSDFWKLCQLGNVNNGTVMDQYGTCGINNSSYSDGSRNKNWPSTSTMPMCQLHHLLFTEEMLKDLDEI